MFHPLTSMDSANLWPEFSGLGQQQRLAATMPGLRSQNIISHYQVSWPDGDRRVLLLGDSRVQQWSTLPEKTGYAFRRSGIGGETSAELLTRLETTLEKAQPDIVVIQIGINDLVAADLNPTHADMIVKAVSANLEEIVETIKDSGAQPILLQIVRPAKAPGFGRGLIWAGNMQTTAAAVNASLPALAARAGITLVRVDDHLADQPGAPLPDAYAVDKLHFSAEGYEALNELIIRELPSDG